MAGIFACAAPTRQVIAAAASSLWDQKGSPSGTRDLVYYQPAVSRSWSVVLIVPAAEAQQLALNIAAFSPRFMLY